MSYHQTPPLSYAASTQSNPFTQGGWKAISHPEDKSNGWDLNINSKYGPAQSSFGALPLATGTQTIPTAPISWSTSTSTTIRFTPSKSTNNHLVNCAIVDSHNRVLYTVTTESPSLTIVKDSERHPVALVEWSSMPVVDIRGDKGKKRLDQWLVSDPNIPNMQLMCWKGVWYSWTADQSNIYLYVQSQRTRPIAIVGSWGPMFEMEFAADAIKCGLLEPSLVAIILIQWGNGYFG